MGTRQTPRRQVLKAFFGILLGVPLHQLVLSNAEASPATRITIAAQLSGASGPLSLQAHATQSGSTLIGQGVGVHRTFASEARFNFTGSISGTVVTLEGVVIQAGFAAIVGTPITITADRATGAIEHAFGPIAGGPLANETLVFTGSGTVVIT